jgi:hypothetical protein
MARLSDGEGLSCHELCGTLSSLKWRFCSLDGAHSAKPIELGTEEERQGGARGACSTLSHIASREGTGRQVDDPGGEQRGGETPGLFRKLRTIILRPWST